MPLYAGTYTELREATRINPTGELPEPIPIPAAMKRLDEMDGLPDLPEAKAVMEAFAKRNYAMHVGHFLIDRGGVVRWTWVESPSPADVTQYGRFPTDAEIPDGGAGGRVLTTFHQGLLRLWGGVPAPSVMPTGPLGTGPRRAAAAARSEPARVQHRVAPAISHPCLADYGTIAKEPCANGAAHDEW